MSEQVITLLLQIPLAGVVVVVVVIFQRSQERIAEKNAQAQQAQTQQLLDFMNQQADVNREFLKTQRDQTNSALGRLAEEQKSTREELAKFSVLIDQFMAYLPTTRKRNRNV